MDVPTNNSTLVAATEGSIGGAAGVAIGNEFGSRNDAIAVGALSAAIVITVIINQRPHHAAPQRNPRYEYSRVWNHGYHCPPGQAKKVDADSQ